MFDDLEFTEHLKKTIAGIVSAIFIIVTLPLYACIQVMVGIGRAIDAFLGTLRR